MKLKYLVFVLVFLVMSLVFRKEGLAVYGECTTNSDCVSLKCGSCPSNCVNNTCTSRCVNNECTTDDGCTPSCSSLGQGYVDYGHNSPPSGWVNTRVNCGGLCNNWANCAYKPEPPPPVCDPPEDQVCSGVTYANSNGELKCVGEKGPVCDPAVAATVCVGKTFLGCDGSVCSGTKQRTCDSVTAGQTCTGSKYADSCGEMTCDGTKVQAACPTTCGYTGGFVDCRPEACPAIPKPTEFPCPASCHTDTITGVSDGNCGTKSCLPIVTPAVACPSTCHADTITVPDLGCNESKSCAPIVTPAEQCPITCHTNTINVSDGACGQASCPSNAPAEDSCPTACNYTGGSVDDGLCGSKSCPAAGSCITYTSMLIKNSADTTVIAESGNRNQICQSDFMDGDKHDRKANFSVTVNNSYGGDRIDTVKIKLGNVMTATAMGLSTTAPSSIINGGGASYYSSVATSVSGNSRTVEFPIYFPEDFGSGNYAIEVYAEDNYGRMINYDGAWANTGRTFKVWSCRVPVKGTLYDNSSGVEYAVAGGENMNFKSLVYNDLGTTSTEWSMNTVMNPASYVSGSNPLIWGYEQVKAMLNDDLAVTGITMRVIDLGVGTTHAVSSSLEFGINNSLVSPYSDSPALQIDYSATADQSPWFQARGGGIVSRTSITNEIPTTCTLDTTCSSIAAMSVSSADIGSNSNSLVSAPNLDNIGCNENCKFGIPNNWSVQSNVLSDRFDYSYFYNQYYVKHSEGKLYNQDTLMSTIINDVGGTGVVYVNGNLTVDINSVSKPGKILVLIVKGNVNIDQSVSNTWGMFVADGKITASGVSDNQLKIEGILYSAKNIEFERGYTTKNKNNTSPAVIVKYQPGFVFALPGKLTKIISGWAQGR